ncbi:centrosomal protein of 192 kDa [Spea bombifrons]|uniref:centrosomal protein of 192 kDa n=1 Tax=Spea bombifrons TaxID=233779 RepID=UPI00234AF1A7|nr:centrosomal protein of 192 kDa [Spea bombifrons]
MTESYSKIEDETFPSFLGESINSNASVALENCTLTSNLGLPVAASTVAKARSGFDRVPDIQASYLCNEKLSPTDSADSGSSRRDSKGKHVLSFKDKLDGHDTTVADNTLSDIQRPESKDTRGLSDDLCTLPRSKHKEKDSSLPHLYKDIRNQVLNDDFGASISSFLENEKLISIASLDGSSSDDLDDEEFYDDQLESYFRKLLPPGMQREAIEGQEISEPKPISYTPVSSPPSTPVSQQSEQLQFLEDYEEDFQMLHVRLAATGMDSAPSSDEDDVELELENAARQHLQRQLVGDQNRPSFRPGLEGGSSEDESSKQCKTASAVAASRQSAEGHVLTSQTPSPVAEVFSAGDGSSGSDDEDKTIQMSPAHMAESWEAELVTRNVAGEESESITQVPSAKHVSKDRKEPVGDGTTSKASQRISSQFDATQASKYNSMFNDIADGKKLDSFYFQKGNNSDKQTASLFNDSQGSQDVKRLSDAYLSPTCPRSHKDCPDDSGAWQSTNKQLFQWSFGQCVNSKEGSPQHSVVYQNEEGKWVTDLAYFKSFDNEPGVRISETAGNPVNESDFIVGNDALAVIEEDQEQFEKEHRFIQEEKMDLENISLNMGDTSWKLPPSHVCQKTSLVSSVCQEDASYLRLSLGEFFGQRSEALGCLGGGQDVKRPSFGYHIISPEKQEPITLLRTSDVSGHSEHDDTIKFCDDTLTPEDLGCLPDDQKLASATFDIRLPAKKNDGVSSVETEENNHPVSDNEGQTITVEPVQELSEQTRFSISQIAKAIANASSSADQSQLTAMIMALSSKNKNIQMDLAPENLDRSDINQLLTASLQKCNAENFDMEKYLRAADISGRESDVESFVQSVKDFTWDMSFRDKQTLQDSVGDLTNITDIQKQDLKKPDPSSEIHGGPLQLESSSEKSQGKAVCHVSSLTSASKATDSGNLPPKVKACVERPVEKPKQNGRLSSDRYTGQWKSGIPVLPVQRDFNTPENKVKPLSERVNGGTQVAGTKPVQNESYLQAKSHVSKSANILKSPKRLSSRLPDEPPDVNDAKKLGEYSHQKRVSFQTSASNAGPHKDTGPHKGTVFTDHDAHGLEEEQYSFRPSTCPLIHSSPSQDSLKISDQGSSDCQESIASEDSCVSPSLSRLTYISMAENTLQTTTIPSPENKSNNTIELSTTIVRASPTPSEMQTNPSYLSWEQKKRQISSTSPLKTKNPSLVNNIGVTKDAFLKRHDKRELDDTVQRFKEKMSAAASSGDSVGSFQGAPVHLDTAFPHTKFTATSGQVLASGNVIPPSGLDKYPLMQNMNLNSQFMSGFTSALPATEPQKFPPSLPTLLTGQPLSTTPFAQHYLGSMPSVGNTSAQTYQVGSSALCSGHHSCPMPTQNAVPGVPLSTNAGLLASLQVNNHMSAKQDIVTANDYGGKYFGAAGLQQWSTRTQPGFGQVLVPEELTFASACCVGIASQASLNVFNPNDRWMQVNLGILSIAVNGDKVDVAAYQCLVFKNKTIIAPRTAEEIQFLFLPQRSGLFQCVVGVFSWPVSADTETIMRAEAAPTKVLLTAVSEYPAIEVDTGKIEGLDFGDLSAGCWKALPLKLINRTHATVPIRLIISANATAWRCFTFSKDPTNLASEYPLHGDISKLSSPSVISHVMHATYDGQEPESIVVWIVFHAPQSYNTSGSLGAAEEFLARVDVEVDSPGPACVLKSVPLHARAGCARIHAPKDLQTIHLLSHVGSSAKQLLPLKNAGNIAVHLKLKSSNPDCSFTVEPEDLFLVPGEEQMVAVKFSPKYSKPQKSLLKIIVQPSGPQYEVSLVGETETTVSRNSINPALANAPDVPPILSNKQFVSWGGVTLGRAVQQKLILRNTSPSSSQHLRLLIRGQDQDCFQLQTIFGPEERLTGNRELTIRAKEDATIHLMFTPTRVGCMLAKLEIKQSGIKTSLPGVKFTIPLSGYGGTSNVILEDVKKLSDSYMVALKGVSPGRASKVRFCVRNTGSRAAYVKAVCFADFQTNAVMDPKVFSVNPEKFVLKERSHEFVTISCNATVREQALCQSSTSLISTVCFFSGDEIARQQYRRALLHKPETVGKVISENPLLKNTRFDEEFPGEHLVSEVYDLPQRPNDVQLFYGNMNKTILSVVGSGFDRNSGEDPVQSSVRANVNGMVGSTEKPGNTSLDVLPVKGPQGPHLVASAQRPGQDSPVSEQTWSVQPESLVLSAPSISGMAGTGHIKLVNNSVRQLQYELSWPAHCLTITPHHGTIEPMHHIVILVSPNPSLATKQNMIPWNGQIYVHCDNGQKFVKVRISGDSHLEKPAPSPVTKPLPILAPHPETPVHMAKPLPKSSSTKVEIKNRTLVFHKTPSGGSSETFLDVENPGEEDVKWLLTSFAPPYVKRVDHSGDVYRVTYAAFRCSRVSGVLAAHDKLKVAISFFPRDRGDYTQYWDLECHPISEPHLKHKVRFQLCGEVSSIEVAPGASLGESQVRADETVKPRRRSGSEASTLRPVQDDRVRGVYAPEELYTFPSTAVGTSSTLKVNLQNNSFSAYMLKFVSPDEPFHMKYSKYSLRAHHYINLPVKFKPSSAGNFEDCLVVQTDTGSICIRLVGEAVSK